MRHKELLSGKAIASMCAKCGGAQETARPAVSKGPWDGEMMVTEEH